LLKAHGQIDGASAAREMTTMPIRERMIAGLRAARDRGSGGGRPRKLTDADLKFARSLMRDKSEHWT